MRIEIEEIAGPDHVFERPCAPAVEHRRWGRSWSATRRAGTVSEITQAHEGARCSKVAGNVVALLYQQCKRVNGCAGMAQVFAAIEAEQAGPQSVPTKNAA